MTNRYDRNATPLATSRILVGMFFVLFGEYKVFGTDFTLRRGFERWIRSFLVQGVYPWMKPVLKNIILPLMVFILGAGLFSVDIYISKKVRTAR